MVFDLDLKHCIYIFLLTSSVQVLNSVFVDRHGRGNRGVHENKNKGRLEKFGFRRETSMHKSTSMTFLKRDSHPPSGGSFTAYGILLCYTFYAMLICYINEIQTVRSYTVELGWIMVA